MTDEGERKREESLRVFSQAATIYDRIGPGSFSHFGRRLVDLAEIEAGANVLDVAAGRGALLFPAAARVGANGHVTAIDFSPDMVRETAKDIESRKLNHAEIRQMDAEQMTFSDASFDRVVCGFALWMFAEPARNRLFSIRCSTTRSIWKFAPRRSCRIFKKEKTHHRGHGSTTLTTGDVRKKGSEL